MPGIFVTRSGAFDSRVLDVSDTMSASWTLFLPGVDTIKNNVLK